MALKNEKSYRAFIKGLITEAGALTFPENASLDEDNFVLNRDGSRSRRLGVDYENLFELIDSTCSEEQINSSQISFYKWDTPAGDSTVSIGVVRVYNKLFFLNLITANPSANLINGGEPLEVTELNTAEVQFANLNNQLVIVSKDLKLPLVLTYDAIFQTISYVELNLKVRDIWGVYDGLKVDQRPVTRSLNQFKLTSNVYGDYSWGTIHRGSLYSWEGRVYKVKGFGTNTSDYNSNISKKSFSNGEVVIYPTHTSGLGLIGFEKTGFAYGGTSINAAIVEFDGYADDAKYTGLTPEHRYNLRNQGWHKTVVCNPAGDPIDVSRSKSSFIPSNADNWTLGKNSNPTSGQYEKYEPDRLKRNSHSNYQVAQGSFVIDAFNRGTSRLEEVKDSKIPALSLDQEQGRISTVCSYAQRLFYSGIDSNVVEPDERSANYNNYIFFSKIVESPKDFGTCYQEADPTDPGINSIVASDGGTIQIPEASRIIKLIPTQSSLLVFAENGIWEIFGDTGGFYANTFQISKITSNGTLNQNSIVEANGIFYYWSTSGIYKLAAETGPGTFKTENISLTTIQTFFLTIPSLSKLYCKSVYDERENRVRWLYNDSDDYAEDNNVSKYNKELIYDLTLEAFSKHSISSLETNSPYIADYITIPNYIVSSEETDILVGIEKVQVTVDEVDTNVVVDINVTTGRSSGFSFLTFIGTDFTISKYKETSFKDWLTADSIGVNYLSYLITGYDVYDNIIKDKQVPYIHFYFNKTEDGFTLINNNLEATHQSSCLVQAQWNWANSANSGKWGPQFQAYRLPRTYIPSGTSDTFDTGDAVITTRNKLRGRGKALSLKIESEEGKDMKLLGWATAVTMNNIG